MNAWPLGMYWARLFYESAEPPETRVAIVGISLHIRDGTFSRTLL